MKKANKVYEFKELDRSLNDFREAVADANLVVRHSVPRYIAMMDATTAAFTLFYSDLTNQEKAEMKAAFDRLADIVSTFNNVVEDNVIPIKPTT